MNIVKPYARISVLHGHQQGSPGFISAGIEALQFIERSGRVSHRSENTITNDSYKRFIPAVVLDHGDWSIVEHVQASVEFLVDRGITHELVRHRLFSFTQESTRFVNYEKKMPPSFIKPEDLTYEDEKDWNLAIQTSEQSYRNMIARGRSPQIARSVFPNALASSIVMTGNLRNWRHCLLMRTTRESHPQMREVTIPLLGQFQSAVPYLYGDIVAMDRQIDAMRKAR